MTQRHWQNSTGFTPHQPEPAHDRSLLLTTHVTPELIDYICQQIVRLVDPERVILFGSQARGHDRADSDVDLLIIVDSSESCRTLTDRIHRFFRRRLFDMDLLVRTVEDVERNVADGNPFYVYHILQQGKVLYERGGETSPSEDTRSDGDGMDRVGR